jgi:hypothetical protein
MTHDKDRQDIALLHETLMHLILIRIIFTPINPYPIGCPFVEIQTIINSICVFQKNSKNLALHTISYLLIDSKCNL